MPKVSIVLPCYNGEGLIANAIESILSQTYKDFELVIVNDCSTDKTQEIALEYSRRDSRVRLINNDVNKKLPASLNVGFANAEGQYLTWTSDDNFYKPNAIEEMVKYLDEHSDCDFVFCDYDLYWEMLNKTRPRKVSDYPPMFLNMCTFGPCFMYTSRIAKKVGEYDKTQFLMEDYDYFLRISLQGKIKALHKNLYTYSRRRNNLTDNYASELNQKRSDVIKQYRKIYYKKYPLMPILVFLAKLKPAFLFCIRAILWPFKIWI